MSLDMIQAKVMMQSDNILSSLDPTDGTWPTFKSSFYLSYQMTLGP